MKLKTRKSVSKRFKIKKNVVLHKMAFKSHLLGNKSSKRLRSLRKVQKVNKADIKVILNSIIS